MRWCDRCWSDHDGICMDESMRLDLLEALVTYFRDQDRENYIRPGHHYVGTAVSLRVEPGVENLHSWE